MKTLDLDQDTDSQHCFFVNFVPFSNDVLWIQICIVMSPVKFFSAQV
jgi:hypothetical protein